MAAEVTAQSSDIQHSVNNDSGDNNRGQLVNTLKPGDSVICVSFVAARELYGDDFEPLKKSMA
jgi:hypothetical protein